MDINQYLVALIHWVGANPKQTLVDLVAFDHVVLVAAQKAGYTKLTSVCQKFANLLTFLTNIVTTFVSGGATAVTTNLQQPKKV